MADNQIRWSDLCMLKKDWEGEEARKRPRKTEAGSQQKPLSDSDGREGTLGGYRVCVERTTTRSMLIIH